MMPCSFSFAVAPGSFSRSHLWGEGLLPQLCAASSTRCPCSCGCARHSVGRPSRLRSALDGSAFFSCSTRKPNVALSLFSLITFYCYEQYTSTASIALTHEVSIPSAVRKKLSAGVQQKRMQCVNLFLLGKSLGKIECSRQLVAGPVAMRNAALNNCMGRHAPVRKASPPCHDRHTPGRPRYAFTRRFTRLRVMELPSTDLACCASQSYWLSRPSKLSPAVFKSFN